MKKSNFRRLGQGALAVGALAMLAGCASITGGGAPEEVVAKRSQAYWDARIKGDYKAAYALTNPGYRKVRTAEQFRATHPGTFAVEAEVKNVSCEPQKCGAGVNLKTKPPIMGQKLGTIDVYSRQTWVLEDGQWWLFTEL
ncbi:MAG: hypothetical protein ACN6O3_05510 [Comamonas sp.]